MNSKEALERLFDSYVSSKFYGINYKEDDEYYNIIKQDLDKLEQLEKELKQTKLNFKNSQIHSKNCYKKLKEKYNEVDYCYKKLSKDNDSLKISFDELFEVYIRVRRELEQLEKENQGVKDDNTRLWHSLEYANNENAKLKKALEKACKRLDDDCPVSQELIDDLDCEECNSNSEECWVKFFLKEAFESVGGSDEQIKRKEN